MKNLIRRFFSILGYEITTLPYPLFASRKEFDKAKSIVKFSTMLTNLRLVSLYDQVVYCDRNSIEGSMVECGVWKGGAVGLMALALKSSLKETNRHLHLFDSFTDICAPNYLVDGARASKEVDHRSYVAFPKAVLGAYDKIGGHGTVRDCHNLIVDRIGFKESNVHYHVGWFQDTVPEFSKKIGPIALLRLDGDWYESTKVCLENLYDQVVSGGFIIIDDYGSYDGCKKAVDEFISKRKMRVFMHRVDASCFYFQKP